MNNNLAAGQYKVQIKVGVCGNTSLNQPTNPISGGLTTPSKIHIDEVRLNKKTDGGKLDV